MNCRDCGAYVDVVYLNGDELTDLELTGWCPQCCNEFVNLLLTTDLETKEDLHV